MTITRSTSIAMLQTVGVTQLVRDFSDVLNRVAYQDARVVITRRGKPQAVLVDYEVYEKLHEHELRAAAMRLEMAIRRTKDLISIEEVMEKTQREVADSEENPNVS